MPMIFPVLVAFASLLMLAAALLLGLAERRQKPCLKRYARILMAVAVVCNVVAVILIFRHI